VLFRYCFGSFLNSVQRPFNIDLRFLILERVVDSSGLSTKLGLKILKLSVEWKERHNSGKNKSPINLHVPYNNIMRFRILCIGVTRCSLKRMNYTSYSPVRLWSAFEGHFLTSTQYARNLLMFYFLMNIGQPPQNRQ